MDNLIFIVSGEKVWTYRAADGGKPKHHRISGEDHFQLTDIREFRHSLCKSTGDIMYAALCDGCQATKCFEEKNITIIYAGISIEWLQTFMSCFLPCKLLRVSAIEDLLPAALLNAGRLSLGEVIDVQFRERAWRISVADDGLITIETIAFGESEPLVVGDELILNGLTPAGGALNDRGKVEQLQNDLDSALAAKGKGQNENERLRTKITELEVDLEQNGRTLVVSPDVLVLREKQKKIIAGQVITFDLAKGNSPSDGLTPFGVFGGILAAGRTALWTTDSILSPASGTLFPLKKLVPIGNDGGVIQAVISSNEGDTLKKIMAWLNQTVIPGINNALLQQKK